MTSVPPPATQSSSASFGSGASRASWSECTSTAVMPEYAAARTGSTGSPVVLSNTGVAIASVIGAVVGGAYA